MSAAMTCFGKRGFHQTSMQDISSEAGISVGLIYRYFESKDAVITAMVDAHKEMIHELLSQAKEAGSLRKALEIFFTANCCSADQRVQSAFIVDLYSEGSRNPHVARLVCDVLDTLTKGLSELIASAPEWQDVETDLTPRELAALILSTLRGLVMRDVIDNSSSDQQRREQQRKTLRQLWKLVFEPKPVLA
jgi:AcrR family transcriptional regulator